MKQTKNLDKPQIDLEDDFFGTVLNCAVRYAIGRQTYMPSLVVDFIIPLLPHLSNKTIWCFERDVAEADSYGDEIIDKPVWIRFLNAVRIENERRKNNAEDTCTEE